MQGAAQQWAADPLSHLPPLRRAGGRRLLSLRPAASKGFGDGSAARTKGRDDQLVDGQQGPQAARRLKNKGKQMARAPLPPVAAPPRPPTAPDTAAEPSGESLVDAMEFNARLAALKAEAEQKKAALAATKTASSDLLRVGGTDAPAYDSPPPLSQTLLGGGAKAEDRSLAEYEQGSFGPSQVGLAVAAVLLGVVFIVASGGSDLGYAMRRPGGSAASQQQQGQQLSDEVKADLEKQLGEAEAKLQADASDLEALEAAAVLDARLGKLDDARSQLRKLTAARPGDAEAWRLLAEASAAGGDSKEAVAAYEKAWEAGGRRSLEVLTGLAGALAEGGSGDRAVALVQAARAEAGSSGLDEADLRLLLGKTYAQWRGHAPDALATYDQLIQDRPEDFRGYLAKGLLLRDVGRAGDAQRAFLQARYHSGASRRAVEAVIDEQQ